MSDREDRKANLRKKLEAIRDGIVTRFGERNTRIFLTVTAVSVILVVCLFALSLLFKINVIDVSGDVTMFNEGEIIRAAGIAEGDLLYGKSSGRIERNIKRAIPLTKTVEVKKSLSGKVSIEISFEKVDYYCKIGNRYYAVDKELRVMDSDESRSKYSAFGAVCIRLPEVREPVIGQKLVFFDTVEETDTEGETLYEVRDEDFYKFTVEFLTILKQSGYLTESNAVILEQKFDIEMVYANKFLIKFGDSKDLEEKFRLLFEILSEGSMNYAGKGVIDLSNPTKAFARADESLDFAGYID